jgi:ATP-binding cassette subfamily B multidrug efflux pump
MTTTTIQAARPRPQPSPMGRGLPGMGRPVGKAKSFGPSARRPAARMRPEQFKLAVVVALGVTSVSFSVAGPKLLGQATDIIFDGVLARLRHVPGAVIDFGALGGVLAWVLVFLASSLFAWAQGRLLNGVVQRVVFGLRAEIEAKLHRLPLRYFDDQPRGELLARVTNDIDNISSTLQQTLSQLLTSVLTVVGVLVMMLTISPLLALIALAVIPLSVLVTGPGRKALAEAVHRAVKHTGVLNAHIEEAFTGHQLVKVFGRQRESEAEFRRRNDNLFGAALRQFTQPLTQVASMANLM